MATKETIDILYVAKVVTLSIVREITKDGFQAKDLGAFVKSGEFEKALVEAVNGADKVPDELSHIGLTDGLVLARYMYSFASDVIAEFRAYQAKKSA